MTCLGRVSTCLWMLVHVCMSVRFLMAKSHESGLDMSYELRYTVYSDACYLGRATPLNLGSRWILAPDEKN